MAEIVVEDITWKKGETGTQKFVIYESDGVTRRDGTGKTYKFKFWKARGTVLKGSGNLTQTDEVNGEYDYSVVATDTDTIEKYIGELIENPTGSKLKSETFDVRIKESSNELTGP